MEDFEKHFARLQEEFLDFATDSVQTLDRIVDDADRQRELTPAAMVELARIVHSIKGMGSNFGYNNLTILAHRLEDFLSSVDTLGAADLADLRYYVDRFGDVVDGTISRDGPIDTVVRALPMRSRFEIADVTVAKVEVGLVMEAGAQFRLVAKELAACGYRVMPVHSSLQAVEYVYLTRPDLVIVSANMPGMDGIDLVRALKAMRATEAIPCALLTAFDRDSKALQAVPKSVPIIRKGKEFGDDLAQALQSVGLL